ncbi:hypothetical protein GTO36_01020 [bacterium]|nr:hypothetical protein [bacterium]
MKGHGSKFPRKKQEAIAALLTQPTIKEAAKSAGVGEKTLWRWLQNEEFRESYCDAKRRVVEEGISRLQQVCGEAVETLKEIMRDQEKPPSSRVTASRIILEMAVKALEVQDLTSRVEKLEKTIESNY